MISFRVTKTEAELIDDIAARAAGYAASIGLAYSVLDARMDITAVHANGYPLRLAVLLAADQFNFAHDILGIRANLNRITGELDSHFTPRFMRYITRRASSERRRNDAR